MNKQLVSFLIICTVLLACCADAKAASITGPEELWPYKVKLSTGWKYGYLLPRSGEWVIKPTFTDARAFNENGLAFVQLDGYYGLIDLSGKMVDKRRFKLVEPLQGGMAKVLTEKGWGILSDKGVMVIPPPLADNSGGFHDGLIRIMTGNQYGFMDKLGQTAIAPRSYENLPEFAEGLAAVKANGKWGYMDKTGLLVIAQQYDGGDSFQEGLAAVQLNHKWGLIDRQGNVIIEPLYDHIQAALSVKIVVAHGRYGLLDAAGQVILPLKYDDIILKIDPSYATSVLRVRGGDKYGYLNAAGQWLYRPTTAFRGDEVIASQQKLLLWAGYVYDMNGKKLNNYMNHLQDGYSLLESNRHEASQFFRAALTINPGDEAALWALMQASIVQPDGM